MTFGKDQDRDRNNAYASSSSISFSPKAVTGYARRETNLCKLLKSRRHSYDLTYRPGKLKDDENITLCAVF